MLLTTTLSLMNRHICCPFISTPLLLFYSYKLKRGDNMNNRNRDYVWRLLILDKSGMYTRIYDEIYGNNPVVLNELYDKYSKNKDYICLILEG